MEYVAAATYLAIAVVIGLETLVLGSLARDVVAIMRSDAVVRRRQLLEEYLLVGEPSTLNTQIAQVGDYGE